MREFKGTPGPWHAEEIVGIYTPIMHSGEGLGYCPPVLAKVTTRHSSAEQAKCNSNLIAAAPELLEALQELFADYKQLADSGDAGFWSLEDTEVGKKSMAVIDKALGK